MLPQQYCLRWKHHHSNVQSMFAQLLEKERFCDVTLYCSPSFATQIQNKDTVEPQNIRGVSLRAHRVVLAACSELLGTLLGAHETQGEPVLVIDGAEPAHLKALLDYMYTGEMNVHHSQLASLLKTAEELRIKGLTDIRWNNKDEPPDCTTGAITTVPKTDIQKPEPKKQTKQFPKQPSPTPKQASPKQSPQPVPDLQISEPRSLLKREPEDGETRININGGPPPLIKIPTKDRVAMKRENSDSEHSPSPKRTRLPSGTENTDDESMSGMKLERDSDWQHGNMDITAERVVGWGVGQSRDSSDDEWADAPTDIGSFLHTRLQVDGDNSNDEESNDSNNMSVPVSQGGTAVSIPIVPAEPVKHDLLAQLTSKHPRFTDVIKLSEYLQHGRRPQFWEEHYVKRVMEAVRLKELEMKQAAEILGVSYGTLYGRYRDVYGCINRPYSTADVNTERTMSAEAAARRVAEATFDEDRERHKLARSKHKLETKRAVRDFWQVKGPSEVLERLQRGEISLDAAASALGVSVANLAAHVADFGPANEFDPIPIEVDASLRNRSYSTGSAGKPAPAPHRKQTPQDNKPPKKVVVGSSNDEECIPVSIISTQEGKSPTPTSGPATRSSGGKWPSIRVANIDSLRSEQATSPSQLMRTRPDLTIVAAKKHDDEDT